MFHKSGNEPIPQKVDGFLGVSFEVRIVVEVEIHNTEAFGVTIGPGEVVEQRPHEEAFDFHSVFMDGLFHLGQITGVVLDPILIVQRFGKLKIVFTDKINTVFHYVDIGVIVSFADPVEHLSESPWGIVQPYGLGGWANRFAIRVFVVCDDSFVIVGFRFGVILDEASTVMVVAEVVGRSFQESLFFGGEEGQVGDSILHGLRIITKEDWISIPTKEEFQPSLSSCDIFWRVGVGFHPIDVESGTDLASLSVLVLLTIELDSVSMRQQCVFGSNVRFGIRVTFSAP